MGGKSYALLVAIIALLTLACPWEARAVTITAGSDFAVVLKSDGSLWTWGNNSSGQLGNSTTTNALSPTPVTTLTGTTWNAVSAGFDFVVALQSGGTMWAWGDDSSSQLGDGEIATQTSPIEIAPSLTWSVVAAGSNFSVAVRSDSTLWTWGNNSSGQLGNGTTTKVTSPAQIGSGTTWSAVSAGSDFVVALQSDGTLWAWGDDSSGQVGNSATSPSVTSPKQIGSGTTWSAISAGSNFVVALQSDGTMWAWGNNSSGQLGNGTLTNANRPIQVAPTMTWSAVAAGSNFAVAVRSDGTMWAWGNNGSGQLGNGTTGNALSPTAVTAKTGTTWSAVAAGLDFAVAIRSDGTLWTWGNNSSGQLGNGTTTNETTPTQIPGFNLLFTVASTVPANGARDVLTSSAIQATFSEAIDPTTITSSTFILSGGLTGSVSYDASTLTATFTPSSGLGNKSSYTATITTGVTDAAGNAMAANYVWSFSTGGKTSCFIATAAYGSPLEPHVAVLRSFRDNYLLTNRAGRSFVDFYYRHSPPLANLIARHPGLRMMTRWALTPIVYGVLYPFVFGLVPPLSFACIYVEKRRRKRRNRII